MYDYPKIEPCPFCGGYCNLRKFKGQNKNYQVVCANPAKCHYESGYANNPDEAIEAHNKVAIAVLNSICTE